MCGLSGIVLPLSAEISPEVIKRPETMTAAIKHRGPDRQSMVIRAQAAIGHVRLALNGVVTGMQPMVDSASGIVMAYNGELYGQANLLRLGVSDSRILLEGYAREGLDYLSRVNAEYAVVFYDERRGQTILARDRFGTKPLYYALDRSQLIFSSEAKGVLASGLVTGELNVEHVLDSLLRIDTNRSTPFAGIYQVPPGCALIVDANLSGKIARFDHLEDVFASSHATCRDGPIEAAKNLQILFKNAVSERLVANYPVGIFLSGGLDSSLVAATAVELGNRPESYTIRFEEVEYDESPWASLVASSLGIDNVCVSISDAQITSEFDKAIFHAEHFVQ